MKLVVTTPLLPPDIGGPATYVSFLLKEYSQTQSTHLIAISTKSSTKDISTVSPCWSSLKRQVTLMRVLYRQITSDTIVYCLDPLVTGFAGMLIATLKKQPFIVRFVGDLVWESAHNTHQTKLGLDEYYQVKKHRLAPHFLAQAWVLNRADAIITPSAYLRSFLIDTYHVPNAKIHLIDNPVTIDKKNQPKRDSFQLLTAARLISHKHVHKIIEAVNKARNTNPWHLTIAGDGPERIRLEKQVKRLNADRWVSFVGPISHPQLIQYMQKATKYIHLSSYEGQSHTLIQALLTNTPIIASNIAPNRELLGDHAVLVDSTDIQSVVNAINTDTPVIEIDSNRFSYKTHSQKLSQVFQLLKDA